MPPLTRKKQKGKKIERGKGFSEASSHVLPGDCLEFDVNELEDYLSELDLENVPTIGMMVGQFQCPVTTLPFGALRSDWARLLLLQRAQPEGSILREKLARLFRVLAIAYFQMEERFDATRSMPATTSRWVRENVILG